MENSKKCVPAPEKSGRNPKVRKANPLLAL